MPEDGQVCPKCQSPYGYPDGNLWICPECAHEWTLEAEETAQDVSSQGFLHLDYYSTNATTLRVFLISPGNETPYTLNVPTSGWNSVNIPLSSFAPVNLSNVIQIKFDGNGEIYLDNIYFGN